MKARQSNCLNLINNLINIYKNIHVHVHVHVYALLIDYFASHKVVSLGFQLEQLEQLVQSVQCSGVA